MSTMMQNVGAAVLLAQQQWNPKTASEPLERAMARAALEAMLKPTDEMKIGLGKSVIDKPNAAFGERYEAMIHAALAHGPITSPSPYKH